jgi:hypothetical protein
MWTLLALAIVIFGGRTLVKFYERHLDRQLGPWIAGDLALQRIPARRDGERR